MLVLELDTESQYSHSFILVIDDSTRDTWMQYFNESDAGGVCHAKSCHTGVERES